MVVDSVFVCPEPAGQTAERSAMKLGMLKLLVTGYDSIPENSRFESRFSRKRENSIFETTVPILGAIFSRYKKKMDKRALYKCWQYHQLSFESICISIFQTLEAVKHFVGEPEQKT